MPSFKTSRLDYDGQVIGAVLNRPMNKPYILRLREKIIKHLSSKTHWSKMSKKLIKRYHITVLLNSDPEKKKLLHPKSIPTSQCYYCTLIFNNFEMFRMKTFEIKPQTGGVNA